MANRSACMAATMHCPVIIFALWVCMIFGSAGAEAAVFTVINTNPAGPGSLAQAIQDARAAEGPDQIVFSIPGSGVHKIDVSGNPLPAVGASTTIDGYTQPGARPNTVRAGSDAVILIQIDGGGPFSKAAAGLILRGGCKIRGLSLTGFSKPFSGAAILIDPGDTPVPVGEIVWKGISLASRLMGSRWTATITECG